MNNAPALKLWIDDLRPAPPGYIHITSVNAAKEYILAAERLRPAQAPEEIIERIDIDHDAGDYAGSGGDYIKLLDWLEETGRSYPLHLHSMNPVGIANMRAIILRNGWKEV